ncbi:MAG: hypothetical protein QF486_06010 [Candidatus Woesearchaeota archaeon]|jgi:uncharacterized membrane protein|nr:hypothetical protein [Candidatus Woesearchaeota archaeon]MDP7180923.1 hypothetical protein [Candidatus Woesearchaeota archaeon]MDP7199140.1 hypothetical protein [Candidatus Woesearchaeota archaeon]MDP7467597.1 hypothetical protein [Candidatus Woesearchaeota archaeon]MDP7647079.1 hypothetical protein [Candidatus Woesearchaeota archaeon]|tara:strand:+ start:55 stop:528 length:474 start_codon:yes stop_codon:yes gene_type:complete
MPKLNYYPEGGIGIKMDNFMVQSASHVGRAWQKVTKTPASNLTEAAHVAAMSCYFASLRIFLVGYSYIRAAQSQDKISLQGERKIMEKSIIPSGAMPFARAGLMVGGALLLADAYVQSKSDSAHRYLVFKQMSMGIGMFFTSIGEYMSRADVPALET